MAAKDAEVAKNDDQNDGENLDISQAAIKKMISEARARGYITYDDLNKALPPDQVSSEQIEDVMSMLSEMGINIIEDEDADEADNAVVVVEEGAREVALAGASTEKLDPPMTQSGCIYEKWVL